MFGGMLNYWPFAFMWYRRALLQLPRRHHHPLRRAASSSLPVAGRCHTTYTFSCRTETTPATGWLAGGNTKLPCTSNIQPLFTTRACLVLVTTHPAARCLPMQQQKHSATIILGMPHTTCTITLDATRALATHTDSIPYHSLPWSLNTHAAQLLGMDTHAHTHAQHRHGMGCTWVSLHHSTCLLHSLAFLHLQVRRSLHYFNFCPCHTNSPTGKEPWTHTGR